MKKTNAMRKLDGSKIEYSVVEYSTLGDNSGIGVAEKTGEDPACVFKTLVTTSKERNFVFVIPSTGELDLKKAAMAAGVKKIEMLPLKDLLPKTGYVHGGCSPIGMKKDFLTYIDSSAKDLPKIYVSGGKIGMQIYISPDDLLELIGAEYRDLTKG